MLRSSHDCRESQIRETPDAVDAQHLFLLNKEIINKSYYERLLLNANFNPFYKVLHTASLLHQH